MHKIYDCGQMCMSNTPPSYPGQHLPRADRCCDVRGPADGGRLSASRALVSIMPATLLALALMGCAGAAKYTPAVEPIATGSVLRIDLPPSEEGEGRFLEFSRDGNFLCVWSFSPKVDPYPQRRVFDAKSGREVAEATEYGLLSSDWTRLFPRLGLGIHLEGHGAWRVYPSRDKSYDQTVNKALGDLTRDAEAFELTEDVRLGLRTLEVKKEGESWWGDRVAELWELQPKRILLWRVSLPKELSSVGLIRFYERDGEKLILIAYEASEADIISAKDGALVERFSYGRILTQEEARQQAKKLGWWRRELDFTVDIASFKAFSVSFDPQAGLLACGGFWDRRVRVVSVDKPHLTVFEAHGDDNPYIPGGGHWFVSRLEFVAGRYLIADCEFAKRGETPILLQPTEVFEIASWTKVWEENSLHIKGVTISPNGKSLALLRGLSLEIGPLACSGVRDPSGEEHPP